MVEFEVNKKQVAILIDPDKTNNLYKIIQIAEQENIDYFFVGGSIVSTGIDSFVEKLKSETKIPVVLFPGNAMQFTPKADAILFMSLLSGRNPEFLISNQVLSAPLIKKSGIQSISTAYILIDGGIKTSVEYISNTQAIPANKPEIAVATAIAGEMFGFQTVYLEAGSGALNSVNKELVALVRKNVEIPLIVGGGIRDKNTAEELFTAGADILVVGSKTEETPEFIKEISEVKSSFIR